MKSKVRPVEMYIGISNGSDFGTWYTDYVEIPIDTPENLINDVAIEVAKKHLSNIAFVGVYSIMPLEDVDEYYDWCNLEEE